MYHKLQMPGGAYSVSTTLRGLARYRRWQNQNPPSPTLIALHDSELAGLISELAIMGDEHRGR